MTSAADIAPWTGNPSARHRPSWTREAAIGYCTRLAESHYENFPVLFGLVSWRQREALAAIYAFARHADDFADEPCFEGARERLLDSWEGQYRACIEGRATHPVFAALGHVIRRDRLPAALFLDLLDAFRQDCRGKRYDTFGEVLDYCSRSADPVGRLVLAVLGLDAGHLGPWSDRICTALQLTNFWQDLSVDIPRDRLYIPLEDLDRFGVSLEALMAGQAVAGTADLIAFEVERTRRLFDEGLPLVTAAPFPCSLYFGAVWAGGRAVLKLTEFAGPNVLHERTALSAGNVAASLWGGLVSRTFGG